jgi:hypothetical protein
MEKTIGFLKWLKELNRTTVSIETVLNMLQEDLPKNQNNNK